MSSVTATSSSEESARRPPPNSSGDNTPQLNALTAVARFNVALLASVVVGLALLLWPYWRTNPDLSHGYLMPVVFLLLLHESRRGYPRYLSNGWVARGMFAALLVVGLLALCASGLYAAALAWSHPLVAFTLTLAGVLLLGAGLFGFASDQLRLLPLNWASCSAVALWMLCAPIPPGSYTRLTLGLQLVVTENVLGALHLLGVAANRHGNIIDLATTSVGVEEACSGVRSLISCVFAGIFFSATLVRGPVRRALLVLLAAPVAIAMNFVRSLTLTLLVNSGIDISGRWHDVTGFAVLALTAAILAGVALLLGRKSATSSPLIDTPLSVRSPRTPVAQWVLTATLFVSGTLIVFFFINTRPSPRHDAAVPDLAAILPAEAAGWHVETSSDLFQFRATLQTDHLAQRTYLRQSDLGMEQITIYLAYWRAGQAPVSLVASHTPDACWPGSGWERAPLPTARDRLAVADRQLPDAEARKFHNGDYPQYVWFWHLYDGHPIAYRDPYSARELLKIALRYGFTHDGDQLFVRVSSNRPWSALAQEPLLAQVFSRLQPLGL